MKGYEKSLLHEKHAEKPEGVFSEISKNIFFHLGLGKTATKFLQYDFFPKLHGVYYISRTRYHLYPILIRNIIKNGNIEDKKILVSKEFDIEIEEEVEKISRLFPYAGIILVLRRQDEWILSHFKRFLKNGYHLKFSEFFNLSQNSGFYYKPSDLFFFPKIKFIEKKMRRKPLVLIYDELRENPFSFLDKIARYVGVFYYRDDIDVSKRRHVSYSENQLMFSYIVSSFINYTPPSSVLKKFFFVFPIRYSVLYAGKLLPSKILKYLAPSDLFPSEDELSKIREYYAEDWEKCVKYSLSSASF